MGLGLSHTSHSIKKICGKSFSQLKVQCRMQAAKNLLLTQPYKLNHIAHLVGVEDPNYFSRMFKRYFGQSANQYRKLNQKEINI